MAATTKPKVPLDHLQSEAEKKLDPARSDRSEVVEVDWEGQVLHVLPVMQWKTSAIHALREGDIELWAQKCLTPDAYAKWTKVDPDMGQAETFLTAWGEKSGTDRPSS